MVFLQVDGLYLESISLLTEFTFSTYCFYFRLQHYVKPIKLQKLVFVPPDLTSNILRSAHRAHIKCFIWIWRQTDVIPFCRIHWLVSTRQKKGAFTARYELKDLILIQI